MQEERILIAGEQISIKQSDVSNVLSKAKMSELVNNLETNKGVANLDQNYRAIVDNFQNSLNQKNVKPEAISTVMSQELKAILRQAANDRKTILDFEFSELNGIDEN